MTTNIFKKKFFISYNEFHYIYHPSFSFSFINYNYFFKNIQNYNILFFIFKIIFSFFIRINQTRVLNLQQQIMFNQLSKI